jgi:hypothetical protein
MREQIEERLAALRQEFEAGRRMLADLETRQVELQQTLLRIGGAVQVLEELLSSEEPATGEVPPGDPVSNGAPVDGRVPAGSV